MSDFYSRHKFAVGCVADLLLLVCGILVIWWSFHH